MKNISLALGKLVISLALCAWLFPAAWYSDAMRARVGGWFGAPAAEVPVRPAPGAPTAAAAVVEKCPPDLAGWRQGQRIEGVDILPSPGCLADNPYAVAAFVRGTNNVASETLMAAGLTPDAVEKTNDRDGDGDPDEIHIRLEVVELNGGSPDSGLPVAQYAIAPGITPGLWLFAPKSFGMATVNFESNQAKDILRAPSPVIRVEQGDTVLITLENSHYMPHTIHFHGVDHPFLDASGNGNDGAPVTSEMPLQPGQARTYEMQPRQTGTMFYHCHVQVQVHVMMGLQGMFVVEENRPDNWLQTLNIGAGQVRVPSVASADLYDGEFDLHFTDLDADLNDRIRRSNDPREIERLVNIDYDITDSLSDYFLLNGHSFPYTFRDSLIVTEPDQLLKLRVLNGGSVGLALHTHGHKPTATHFDGIAAPPGGQVTRDVFWLASAQRMDLDLDTTNDGLHSYGSGVWLLHDHQQRAVTSDGLGPGGNLGAIVYREFLGADGWPRTFGENLDRFFDPAYYQRPVATSGASQPPASHFLRLVLFGIAIGALGASLVSVARALRGRAP